MTTPSLPRVPVLDLAPDITAHYEELRAAFDRVLRSGQFIMGPEVVAFEAETAEYLGTRHAVGVNSGTDALVIALRALGVGPGDDVITTPFSFFATAESIGNVGATPVFVDIDPATFNIDPALLEAAISERTKVILPVHLYGRPCEMDPIMAVAAEHGVKVVEDCAQSFGARYRGRPTGTMGDVGAFSFFPSKNLGAFGDAGLIATDDDDVAETARMLRAHGSKRKYHNEVLGYNSRLDSLQAALLRVKLPHVDAANRGRIDAAERYVAALQDVAEVVPPAIVDGHVFHQFTVRVPEGRRDAVARSMQEDGVDTMVYYPVPQHLLPVYRGSHGNHEASEAAAREVLSLPLWPSIEPAVQRHVIDVLARHLR